MTNLTPTEIAERETLAHSLMLFSDPHYKLKGFEIIRSEGVWFLMGTAEFPCGCVEQRGACGAVPEQILKELHENFMESATQHGGDDAPTLPKETLH